MSVSRSFHAQSQDEGRRLDQVLADNGLYPSRSNAANAAEQGRVLVNAKPATKRQIVHAGDMIIYEVIEEAPHVLSGEPIPLDIRYEDDHLMVISKQVGLVCHPSSDHLDGTLVNALIYHCGAENLCNVQGQDDRLGIVHRLDQGTSGLMLVAKDNDCAEALMDAIRQRTVDRRYLALVHGLIAHETGMVDAPIARHPKDRKRMAIRDCDSSRDALTTFRVIERFESDGRDNGYTLIDCKLYTGRTHQIRVHLEYARHPLVGEQVYTAHMPHDVRANLGLDRQFLHSFMLNFTHPATGESMSFDDGLPHDLADVVRKLEPRAEGLLGSDASMRTLVGLS